MLDVVVGGGYGDEGKGKVVSYLAIKDKVAVNARAGVGPNAGHTVIYEGKNYKVRQIPSGFVNPSAKLLIGSGVLIDPEILMKEINEFSVTGRLVVDSHCSIIEPAHKEADRNDEYLSKKISTTGTGCGPAQVDRVKRVAKQAHDAESLKEMVGDVPEIINSAADNKERVIIEATQGTFLSLYHGSYPFVTSKDTTASAACSDVGIGPGKVDNVIVVFKSFLTRVGNGPLEGEISPAEAKQLNMLEFGTVTGRQRRAAPFSKELAKRSIMINGATQVAITKLDTLYPSAAGVKRMDALGEEPRAFIENLEKELKVPITLVGTGGEAEDMIDMRKEKGF